MIHIAICDDNASELKQIKTIVEKISLIEYEIHEYTDPNECIQAIEQGMIFDCFLLDILMNKRQWDRYRTKSCGKHIRIHR